MHNILIVDDEETIRITLFEWFASALAGEANILMAEHGADAVRVMKESPVNLLITDLNMPKMDGFELIAHMNNNHPSTPVIVMSAFATPDIKKKVAEMGAITFLAKPLNFEDLEAIDFPKLLAGNRGHVNGISLQSFMQLIDMEGKTCTLIIESQGRQAVIYIDKGELIDARTGNMSGEEAAYEILTWSVDEELTIEIDNSCPKMERKIEFTIMHLLMESARLIDERKNAAEVDQQAKAADQQPKAGAEQQVPEPQPEPSPPPPTQEEPEAPTATEAPPPESTLPDEPAAPATNGAKVKVNTSAAALVEIQKRLKEFSGLDGFSGVALISHSGETMCKVSGGNGLNAEKAAVMANNVMIQAKRTATGMGDADCVFIHLETTGGHALVSCLERNNEHPDLRLILFLKNDDAMGLAKMMLRTTLEEIMSILVG